MQDHTATIRLSQEELLIVLQQIDVQSILGLDSSSFAQLAPEMRDALLDAGRRALIARNLILFDEDGVPQLEPAIQAAVFACAFPGQAFVVMWRREDSPVNQSYFYRVPEFFVTHTLPMEGVHEFQISMSSNMGLPLVQDLAHSLPVANGVLTPTYTLERSVMSQVQQLAAQDRTAAIECLTAAGVHVEHARSLVEALDGAIVRLTLQSFYRFEPEVEQHVVILLGDDTSRWLIEAEHLWAESVTVRGVSLDQALEMIDAMHGRFEEALEIA